MRGCPRRNEMKPISPFRLPNRRYVVARAVSTKSRRPGGLGTRRRVRGEVAISLPATHEPSQRKGLRAKSAIATCTLLGVAFSLLEALAPAGTPGFAFGQPGAHAPGSPEETPGGWQRGCE